MIFPNIMVKDVITTARFYRDIIGMKVMFYAGADQSVFEDGNETGHDIVFAMLELNGAQLGLQEVKSLSEEIPQAVPTETPTMTGSIYFRETDTAAIQQRASQNQILKNPVTSWYGMREMYLTDPDGYVICCAEQDKDFSG